MLNMFGRIVQKIVHGCMLFYTQDRNRTKRLCFLAFAIFVLLCLYEKHHLESQLRETSTFRMEQFAEQLDTYKSANGSYQYVFSTSKGKAFHPDQTSLVQLGLPLNAFVSPSSPEEWGEFVFLTAVSEHFVRGCLNLVASVDKYFPKKKIIVYNLGLTSSSLAKISHLPNVIVETFDYDNYPEHVRNLFSYAFKPIIIHKVLRIYPGVFWVDSAIIMTSSNMSGVFEQLHSTKGILLHRNTGHSNFAVTHGQMYSYLPTSEEHMKKTEQREANSVLIYRTREVYMNIVMWWTLCALQQKCISPLSNRSCRIIAWDTYANCHRFDQSALNILLANYFNFNDTAYVFPAKKEILKIKRNQ